MMKKKKKHTDTRRWKILAEKIVKKIRSSISRPHRTQFPLVHINIHNRQVSPSHLYNYLSRTQSHTFPAHARMDVAMETLCKRRRKSYKHKHTAATAVAECLQYNAIDSGWTNTFAPSPPPVVVVVHLHTHTHTHDHIRIHTNKITHIRQLRIFGAANRYWRKIARSC